MHKAECTVCTKHQRCFPVFFVAVAARLCHPCLQRMECPPRTPQGKVRLSGAETYLWPLGQRERALGIEDWLCTAVVPGSTHAFFVTSSVLGVRCFEEMALVAGSCVYYYLSALFHLFLSALFINLFPAIISKQFHNTKKKKSISKKQIQIIADTEQGSKFKISTFVAIPRKRHLCSLFTKKS